MKDQARERLERRRLQKKVKIAERLQIPIFISAVLIYWGFNELTGTQQMFTLVVAGVCVGSLLWRQAIWRDLRNAVAHKSIGEVSGLISGLALANACGYKLAFDTKPHFNSLGILLQRDGEERPFATVYLSDRNSLYLFGSEVEEQLKNQLNLGIYYDQDTLKHLAAPPPSTELELISTQSDNSIRPMKKEYRICKLKIPQLLLDEGFVVPLSDSERKDFQASYEWAEKSNRYWSIENLGREVEGWELLSLFPLEAQSGNDELIALALMQRSVTS